MKEKKIGVSKVTIQLGDKEATLTVEQARELRDALNELLGERVIERVIEKDIHYPHYWYPSKVYVGDVPTIPPVFSITSTWTSDNTKDYVIAMDSQKTWT